MDKSDIVKKNLLRRKIKEYFTKNPTKKSAIFEINFGGKTYWRVVKEDSSYSITEVTTTKNKFLMELPARLRVPQALPSGDQEPGTQPPQRKPDGTVAAGSPGKNPLLYNPSSMPKVPSMGKSFAAPVARPPEPMDDDEPTKKVDPAKVAAGKAYDATTRDMVKWQPGGGSEFDKELNRTKDLKATISKMPPDHFKRNFGYLGVQNPGELFNNPKKWLNAVKFMAHQNPQIAKMTSMPHAHDPLKPSTQKLTLTNPDGSKRQIGEASSAFASITTAFMDYMAKPNDHLAASNFVNTISREKTRVTDPKEKQSIADIEKSYLGNATKSVDSSTKSTPLAPVPKSPLTTNPLSKSPLAASKVTEAEDKDDNKKEKKKDDKKDSPKKEKGIEIKPQKDVPGAPEGDPAGLEDPVEEPAEAEPVAPPEDPGIPTPEKSPEEAVVSQRLSGQTIKNATVQLRPNGGMVNLELVGMKIPASIQWDSSGKVIFNFKNRPYILRHG
jgi:hypothetical protein